MSLKQIYLKLKKKKKIMTPERKLIKKTHHTLRAHKIKVSFLVEKDKVSII